MPAIRKPFDLMGDDIVKLSTENESIKIRIGLYDEKWLEASETKSSKQIEDEKRVYLIMSRMGTQMEKQY